MKNPFIIKPTGLKGNEKLNRMRELMGQSQLNEDVKNSVVELTKLGPDGKVYGVVREGHNYFIKITDKQSNLVTEDFNYIGGLMNKSSEVYPSYAKAIKQLNLKLMSLNEAHGKISSYNAFADDNLLAENDAAKDILDKSGEKLSYDSKEGKEEGQFGDNLAEKNTDDEFEAVKLSENEMAIEEMLTGESEIEEAKGKNNPWAICTASVGREDKEKFEKCVMDVKKQHDIKESKKGFSIENAMANMDSIIGEDASDKVSEILNSLTESEREALLNTLKKKA